MGHWSHIASRAARDILVFASGYLLANYVRFTGLWRIEDFIPSIFAGAGTLVSITYILGLYSVESQRRSSFLTHSILLTFAFLIAFVVITLVGFVTLEFVGRGFMALGCLFSYPVLLFSHWLLYHKHRIAPERIAFVGESEEEIAEYERLRSMCPSGVQLVGRIGIENDQDHEHGFLGRLRNVRNLMQQ
ncbi:hypothetical protein, partial [Prosthecobacter sp.]|uniref:hypothetical protein n=1 Tax=Prosthecobacter sp. TaxID=1965333 RepID=UPI0037C57F29